MNKFLRFSALIAAFFVTASADAATPQNSRSANATNVAPARAAGRDVTRGENNVVSRTATARATNAARSVVNVGRGDLAVSARNTRNARTVSRAAAARTATTPARATTNTVRTNVSRAATARATAIFDDVSKIGGGYAQCRESYATCMDQFCAKANDTYRRCFCSNRFTEFRDAEDALDQAKVLLQRFEDNNLNAVDKTVAEVDAMYSATVGEAAIKNDTSGAAKLLAEIGDLLSGKKQTQEQQLNLMSIDFSADIGDVWGASASSSIFSTGGEVDFASLEGDELFARVHQQCAQMAAENCQSAAVANMAKSAYGIMITQDCNAYEKSIDTKRQQVQNTVRQAEKILREARLEEYRAHNSQDVNECLDKVRSAIMADTACGANYVHCLDNTGTYIKNDGTPHYSPRLFELADLIDLDGSADVLANNAAFSTFLESRKMFATTALDTCRDISDVVWNEFKRSAIIEIAQAQDDKIEEIKASCVDTIRQCYDTQSNALKSFDDTTAQAAGAISAYAASQMCYDKVQTCAALYGGTDGCKFDANGKLANGGGECGLSALLSYIDAVDTVRVVEGCDTALKTFVTDMCTPTSGSDGYPYNCRELNKDDLKKQIKNRAELYCVNEDGTKYSATDTTSQVATKIDALVENVQSDIARQLMDKCESVNGVWYESSVEAPAGYELESKFYYDVFGSNGATRGYEQAYGTCVKNSTRYACMMQDEDTGGHGYAKYSAATDTCVFTDEWYEYQCKNMLDGNWDDGVCYWDSTTE